MEYTLDFFCSADYYCNGKWVRGTSSNGPWYIEADNEQEAIQKAEALLKKWYAEEKGAEKILVAAKFRAPIDWQGSIEKGDGTLKSRIEKSAKEVAPYMNMDFPWNKQA